MTDDLERRRREDDRNRENRARLAMAYARWDSNGNGNTQFEDACDFGLTFIEEPYVATGHKIDIDALADSFNMDPDDPLLPIPQVTSFVVEWDQDDRGFWVGAFAACAITFSPEVLVPEDLALTIQHHFSFAAIAFKDVPVDDGQ